MNTSDPNIVFDANGYCNHCTSHLRVVKRWSDPEKNKKNLDNIIEQIKIDGKGKDYDCVIGVSGGVDSTYVAYLVKFFGLRPLAVHLDNGWNSELAVNNIQNTLKKLDIDLNTWVLDWNEFSDIQLSMLKASTPDSEIPTDHAIRAVLQKYANKFNIKYILNGRNFTTEGISPWAWTYSALDWKYIKNIHKRYGLNPIKNYPYFSMIGLLKSASFDRVKQISILNYINFTKDNAIKVLKDELNWRDYGGKHYESIYTRFFQSYILPVKFGYDKRRSYLSVLIITGQLKREDALKMIKEPTYPDDLMQQDREYVIKKFKLSEAEFEKIIESPLKTFKDYKNNSKLLYLHKNKITPVIIRILKKLKIIPKHFAANLVPVDNSDE
jgi:N-acetyl sugar amidotransferase